MVSIANDGPFMLAVRLKGMFSVMNAPSGRSQMDTQWFWKAGIFLPPQLVSTAPMTAATHLVLSRKTTYQGAWE